MFRYVVLSFNLSNSLVSGSFASIGLTEDVSFECNLSFVRTLGRCVRMLAGTCVKLFGINITRDLRADTKC